MEFSSGLRHSTTREIVIIVLGHSYIRRLEEFIRQHPRFRDLQLQNVRVKFIGIGGATLHRRHRSRCIMDYVDRVLEYNPDIVFIHIGENDLSTRGITSRDLTSDFDYLARRFTSYHVRRVIIGFVLDQEVLLRESYLSNFIKIGCYLTELY